MTDKTKQEPSTTSQTPSFDYSDFWDRSWKSEDEESLSNWLESWHHSTSPEIKLFKSYGVKTVCDAACGFGAHTIALASNGFDVSAFDVSPKAVELTIRGLRKYGFKGDKIKTSDILKTDYTDESFDAVTAYAVLDHLTQRDAQCALKELLRITKSGGLLLLSFDTAEAADYSYPHELHSDGSMLFKDGTPYAGMIFCPYDKIKIEALIKGKKVIFQETYQKGNQIVILQK